VSPRTVRRSLVPGSTNFMVEQAGVFVGMGKSEDEARLYAAAPDLLTFAQSIAENLVLSGSTIGEQARAVIAKATTQYGPEQMEARS